MSFLHEAVLARQRVELACSALHCRRPAKLSLQAWHARQPATVAQLIKAGQCITSVRLGLKKFSILRVHGASYDACYEFMGAPRQRRPVGQWPSRTVAEPLSRRRHHWPGARPLARMILCLLACRAAATVAH